MVNIRTKGQGAEREVASLLNGNIMLVMRALGFPEGKVILAATTVQRNQNQSAVGGADLSNTFGLAIEIKRQEKLHINTWWDQCATQARKNNEHPVLIFRQSNEKWRVMTIGALRLPDTEPPTHHFARLEMNFIDFQAWFRAWVKIKLQQGEEVRR